MKQKIAIVYDRVNKWGGAERVLLALHEMFPKAPLYTSVYDVKRAPWAKVFPKVYTSFLQKIPFASSNHEFFAPLMPLAFNFLDFSDFDVVISVTSEFAKGIRTIPGTLHICYCLTPTRYLWSGYDGYFKGLSFKVITKPIVKYLKRSDLEMAKNPDVLVAISTEVRNRIKKYYRRNSKIVFPPVDTVILYSNAVNRHKNKGYYLLVSRLDYGYKKVDLAIETFNDLGLPLVIVGTGREEKRLRKIAAKSIKFTGRVSERKLADYYRNAKALIMPQEEDFGIVAVEAQGYGVPVIAYKKGGASDTVIDGATGVLFNRQTAESLKKAILRFENTKFKADNLIKNARRFAKEKFKRNFAKIVEHERKKREL